MFNRFICTGTVFEQNGRTKTAHTEENHFFLGHPVKKIVFNICVLTNAFTFIENFFRISDDYGTVGLPGTYEPPGIFTETEEVFG